MKPRARTFRFSFPIPHPAAEVWNLLYDRYTQVADYANEIVASRGTPNSPSHGQGCQRVCDFDENGSKYLLEELTDVNEDQMRLTNKIIGVGKFPIVPDVSKTTFTVHPKSSSNCVIEVEFQVRTKPAFLSLMMKGAAQKQMGDLFLGAEHFLRTGQAINKRNFKAIKAVTR